MCASPIVRRLLWAVGLILPRCHSPALLLIQRTVIFALNAASSPSPIRSCPSAAYAMRWKRRRNVGWGLGGVSFGFIDFRSSSPPCFPIVALSYAPTCPTNRRFETTVDCWTPRRCKAHV